MSRINTLDVTPGAFSMYRTADIRNVGGFDEGNITEDLEMAWSLRKSGKDLGMVYQKRSNTELPGSIKGLYDQRVRWARGFIVNAWKHRDMFFKKKYGWFGRFQLPLQAIFPVVTVVGLFMFLSGIGESIYNAAITYSSVGFVLPSFDFNALRMFLGLDLKVYIPLATSLMVVAVIMKQAYQKSGENVKHPVALTIYFFAYFIAKSFFWATAILKEMFRTKRIWT
jgi:cellulose synthase/poly-beta-1,6-N-acetylglucosamine synthase-like glycosyltransferase